MKLWQILASALIFSACSTISSLDGYNEGLPVVKNIKTMADVGSVAFEWDVINHPEVQGYVLYRDSGKGAEEVAYIKNPRASHYVDTGLIPETEYSYHFYTLSKNAHSASSEIIKIKTSFIDSVSNLYASNDYPKKVKLLWNPHPNPSISHYLVQRQIDNDEFKTIGLVNHRLLVEYVDEDLNDESRYKYRVIAVDFMGSPSRPSKIVTAKTKDRPINQSTLTATKNLPHIVLNWDPIHRAKDYKIYRSKNPDGVYNYIATTTDTRFVDNVGTPNTVFYYKISGVDSTHIESSLSKAALGQTKPLPASPKIIKGYVDNNQAIIEWEANSEAKYYIIYRESGLFTTDKFRANSTSFIDKDISVGKEYTYYVVAVDEFGLESIHSQEVVLSIR